VLKNGMFNYNVYYNTTRTSISSATSYDLWSVTFNKLSSTSIIVVEGVLHFREEFNSEIGMFCKYGTSGNVYNGMPYMSVGDNTSAATDPSVDTTQYIASFISGYTTTGSQTFTIGWAAANGSSNRPSPIWNPKNQDDGRIRPDNGSIMYIWEVEP
jgi:hypothetical protein